MSRLNDTLAMIKSLQLIVEAGLKLQQQEMRTIWKNSSVKSALEELPSKARDQPINIREFVDSFGDTTSRMSTVFSGITDFMQYDKDKASSSSKPQAREKPLDSVDNTIVNIGRELKLDDIPIAPEHKELVKSVSATLKPPVKERKSVENIVHSIASDKRVQFVDIKLSPSDKALLKKLDREHRDKMSRDFDPNNGAYMPTKLNFDESVRQEDEEPSAIAVVPNPKSLTSTAKQRKVPSSRVSRMVSFGTLAAGLGLGTLAEYTKRTLGIIERDDQGNIFMNKANMERIVDTLCKVRGAALKIGQILSIQDESIVDPELSKALERVRKAADFMPTWQLEGVLVSELGENWNIKVRNFEMEPFAAASIGQVHRARTLDGRPVAVKIQYPGVAKSIESDIDNLIAIMKVWNIFPPGMFVDNVVIVAKRELAWEVDYIREADCTRTFKRLVAKFPYYHVPEVIDELSTKQVFTSELIDGVPVDQCVGLPMAERRFIAEKMLELVLREIMDFQYMQTDPNWANFLYNARQRQICLLDFGASRPYSKKFTDNYVRIIKAASEADRDTILTYSRELGFFTGYESKIMEDAHVDAVMILGEVFRGPGEFNFCNQNTTERIQSLVPTMLAHRLCPPPEEIYSLHRKISGVFLLCSKLKVSVAARQIFYDLYNKYKFDH